MRILICLVFVFCLSASTANAQWRAASYYHYPAWVMERIDTKLHADIEATKARYWATQQRMYDAGDPRAATTPLPRPTSIRGPVDRPTWYIWRHANLAAPWTLHNWPPDADIDSASPSAPRWW